VSKMSKLRSAIATVSKSASAASAVSAASAASFSADWLQQREPFDAAARDAAAARLALQALQESLALQERRGSEAGSARPPLRVIDLACGTGANLRWLAPRLGGAQQWLVADHDAALLQRWPACLGLPVSSIRGRLHYSGSSSGSDSDSDFRAKSRTESRAKSRSGLSAGVLTSFSADIVRRRLDLAQDLESLPWHAAQLVTASALLDLVSAAWLQRLVAAAAAARAAVLMALSVDGRQRFTPRDADDAAVAALFEQHQQRDKGFGGPALGAAAGSALVLALRRAGYCVSQTRSDWRLDGRHDAPALALQRALIDGMADAAVEQQPAAAATVRAWQQRRLAWVLAGRSTLRVGHLDVLALPPR